MQESYRRNSVANSVKRGRMVVTTALVAFVAAVLIHNDFGLDPAPAPAAILIALTWWKPRRALLLASAIVIAVPAFSFLQWEALARFSDTARFWNHFFLLLAGILALAGASMAMRPLRTKA